MTPTLPRPIEPGEPWTGDRVRAERTDGTDRHIYEITVSKAWPTGVQGEHVYLSRDEYTFTLLDRPAPTPAPAVGSRWKLGSAKYVRTDDRRYVLYEGRGWVSFMDDTDSDLIARLTPIPDHGTGCSPWLWDKETDTGWVEAALDDSDRSHVQVSGRYLNGAYLLKNSNPDCAIAARLRPWSERGQANG